MGRVNNQRGQGVIETLLTLPLLLGVMALFVVFSFRSFLYFYSDFQLHEALVCASDEQAHDCQNNLSEKIKAVLLLGQIEGLHISRSSSQAQGEIRISFAGGSHMLWPGSPEMILKKELSLPLQGSAL